MENTVGKPPVLDSSVDSHELVSTFTPDFYEYIRSKPGSVDSLLRLYKNGNEKALEVLTYLIGTPPVLQIVGNQTNHLRLYAEFYKGNAYYDLRWSNLRLKDTDEEKPLVEFEIEAVFDDYVDMYMIRDYILTPKNETVFRKKFLLEVVSNWLKERGFRLRRSNPKKDNGMLAPYIDTELTYIDRIPNPEHPNKDWIGTAKKVTGIYSIQILPLE